MGRTATITGAPASGIRSLGPTRGEEEDHETTPGLAALPLRKRRFARVLELRIHGVPPPFRSLLLDVVEVEERLHHVEVPFSLTRPTSTICPVLLLLPAELAPRSRHVSNSLTWLRRRRSSASSKA